jgi:hypothetical protein
MSCCILPPPLKIVALLYTALCRHVNSKRCEVQYRGWLSLSTATAQENDWIPVDISPFNTKVLAISPIIAGDKPQKKGL